MILAMAFVAARHTWQLPTGTLLVTSAATLLVYGVATEVSALYRSWRSSRMIHEIWCVLISWLYTASAVLGLGMLTQYNTQYT